MISLHVILYCLEKRIETTLRTMSEFDCPLKGINMACLGKFFFFPLLQGLGP